MIFYLYQLVNFMAEKAVQVDAVPVHDKKNKEF